MSENQIIHDDGSSQRENQIDRVENFVVEPKKFINYHNSIVINLTLNVTGYSSEAEISKIIKTATEKLQIDLKEILKTNFDGEGRTGHPIYQLEGDAEALADLLTEVNQETDLEQKSSCVFISHYHHFQRANLTLSQVVSLCHQISQKKKS